MSAAILLVELGITRLFSVITWYHFAFLAVSLALFGLSASGVFIHLFGRRHPPERALGQMSAYALCFCLFTLVTGYLFLRTPVGAAFSSQNVWALTRVYLLAAAPFFAGGACLTLAVSRLHADINRVYAADLAGAAVGCMLFIPALNLGGGAGPLLGAAVLAALSTVLFRAWRGFGRVAAFGALVAVGGLLAVHLAHPFLDIRYTKAGERPFLFTKWNSHSRIAVYPENHPDWGLSETYHGPHPKTLFMDIDASASTPILLAQSLDEVQYLRAEITSLGYLLVPAGGSTLVIGPGGGRDVWTGLVFGARRVTGVEINSIIVDDVMDRRFRTDTGDLYHRPDVAVYIDDGRNFIARSREKYDLIQASLVDTWAATAAGAFSLTENNLYTVEAFAHYFEHLKPDGILAISRWTDDLSRVVALARAAAEKQGWPTFADHLFIAGQRKRADGYGNLSTAVIKRSPITEGEVARLTTVASELDFPVQYSPPIGGQPATGDALNVEVATTTDPGAFYRRQPVDRSPVTDDRPFFFQNTKREALGAVFKRALSSSDTDGMTLLARLLYISLALVAAFILIPLALGARARERPQARLPFGSMGYFGCLGIGFMLIEIGLMQRFVLFLGHPVYSLTVILFTLLLGGGLGSSLGRRFGSPGRTLGLVVPLVMLVGVAYAFVLPPLLAACLGFGIGLRIAIAGALLLPLGILLGMPLPAGVALLGRARPDLLAWAWAINGATSVLGSIIAVLLALVFGFRAVALVGAGVYGIAFALGLRIAVAASDAGALEPVRPKARVRSGYSDVPSP